jgi:hypothetical protein
MMIKAVVVSNDGKQHTFPALTEADMDLVSQSVMTGKGVMLRDRNTQVTYGPGSIDRVVFERVEL